MKVTQGNNPAVNNDKRIDKQPAGNEFSSSAVDGLTSNAVSEKSDFAGVLDKVTRSHNESPNRTAERSSEGQADSRDNKTREKDEVDADVSTSSIERPLTREPVSIVEVNNDSRAILHSVDLDNIVTACQVQLGANGQKEVTLELSRSMLEGLRVKVSADAGGRITADFLAANEGIKSLLDNRSSELIELLRSRGINVAEFKSSVAADAHDRNESREQQPTPHRERISDGVTTLSETEPISAAEDGLASGATYRA